MEIRRGKTRLTLNFQHYIHRAYPNIAIQKIFSKQVRIKVWLLPDLPCWEAKRSTKVLTCLDTVRHAVVYFVCLWRNRRFNTTNKFTRKDTEKRGYTNDKRNTVDLYVANMKCSDLPDRRNTSRAGIIDIMETFQLIWKFFVHVLDYWSVSPDFVLNLPRQISFLFTRHTDQACAVLSRMAVFNFLSLSS